jgi:hypothetical protein
MQCDYMLSVRPKTDNESDSTPLSLYRRNLPVLMALIRACRSASYGREAPDERVFDKQQP